MHSRTTPKRDPEIYKHLHYCQLGSTNIGKPISARSQTPRQYIYIFDQKKRQYIYIYKYKNKIERNEY